MPSKTSESNPTTNTGAQHKKKKQPAAKTNALPAADKRTTRTTHDDDTQDDATPLRRLVASIANADDAALRAQAIATPRDVKGAPYDASTKPAKNETLASETYIRAATHKCVLPEPRLLRTLREPLAHGSSYSCAHAELPLGEEGVSAIVTSVGDFHGVSQLVLSGLRRDSKSLLPPDEMMALARAVHRNAGLHRLELCDCALTDDASEALARLISTGSKLSYLNLSRNSLGEKSARALLSALDGQSALAELDISANSPLSKWSGLADALGTAFKKNKSLRAITVTSTDALKAPAAAAGGARVGGSRSARGRSQAAAAPKATALARAPSAGRLGVASGSRAPVRALTAVLAEAPERLATLRLVGEMLSDTTVAKLSTLLSDKRCTISELTLTHAYVRDAGAATLAAALPRSASLTSLGLALNGISAVGARALSSCMSDARCKLSLLSLASNPIGDGGAAALAGLLSSGVSGALRKIDLARTGIGESGVRALEAALACGGTLESLGELDTLPVSVGSRCSLEWRLRANREAVAAKAEAVEARRARALAAAPEAERELRQRIFELEEDVARAGIDASRSSRERDAVERLLSDALERNNRLSATVASLCPKEDDEGVRETLSSGPTPSYIS